MYKIKCSQTPPTLNLYIASSSCGLAERNEGMVLGVLVLCANRHFVGNLWAFSHWHSYTYLCSICLGLGFMFTNLLCCLAKYT